MMNLLCTRRLIALLALPLLGIRLSAAFLIDPESSAAIPKHNPLSLVLFGALVLLCVTPWHRILQAARKKR
jgi:hypothetical protein